MSEQILDSFLTLGSECAHEIKIKGSRFIALGYPAETSKAVTDIIEQVRKKEFAATHHCFAWSVGWEKEQFKYSDDGEPSGTAGKPIYRAMADRNLRNVLIMVVRYFGGTKLGTGGLSRAYAQAAKEMLDKANIIEKLICDNLHFNISFSLYDKLMNLINTGKHQIVSQNFADEVTMDIAVRKSQSDAFAAKLNELSGGRIEIRKS